MVVKDAGWNILCVDCSVGCELDAVDQYGRTALYQAAELGCADIVRQFIKANANINRADTRGCTPFTGWSFNFNRFSFIHWSGWRECGLLHLLGLPVHFILRLDHRVASRICVDYTHPFGSMVAGIVTIFRQIPFLNYSRLISIVWCLPEEKPTVDLPINLAFPFLHEELLQNYL